MVNPGMLRKGHFCRRRWWGWGVSKPPLPWGGGGGRSRTTPLSIPPQFSGVNFLWPHGEGQFVFLRCFAPNTTSILGGIWAKKGPQSPSLNSTLFPPLSHSLCCVPLNANLYSHFPLIFFEVINRENIPKSKNITAVFSKNRWVFHFELCFCFVF